MSCRCSGGVSAGITIVATADGMSEIVAASVGGGIVAVAFAAGGTGK